MNKWDCYFMDIALRTALMSKCKRLQVGAVIVLNNRIVATGYNGLPVGYEPDICEDCDKTLPEVIHAELNAVLDCAKRGVSCEGGILYVTHSPCRSCSSLLSQAGIKTIYYLHDYRICSTDIFEKLNIKVSKLTK